MTNTEHDERVREIRERHRLAVFAYKDDKPPIAVSDIDFLLSLLDSQAAEGAEWRTVAEKYQALVARTENDAATAMRAACVAKVREYLTDCRDEEAGIIEAIASELESLTVDQVKQEAEGERNDG